MNSESIEELKKQHIANYKKVIVDTIQNNTFVLVDEDIKSLFRKPPLDSMDLILVKFLDLAKKNSVVLNTDELSRLLEKYRSSLLNSCDEIRIIRIKELNSTIDKIDIDDNNVVKINKKDFTSLNKKIKSMIKDNILISFEDNILKEIHSVFSSNIDDNIKENIINGISNYIKGNYKKQILENLDIKILVKDTTLINSIKEQTDRYLFTINNSRLFND